MFENVGEKIKLVAKISFICLCIASFVVAIYYWSGFDESTFIGFLILVAGCAVSYVGSLFLYAFGELVEKTTKIEQNMYMSKASKNTVGNNSVSTKTSTQTAYGNLAVQRPQDRQPSQPVSEDSGKWVCKKCGAKNQEFAQYCKSCGSWKK